MEPEEPDNAELAEVTPLFPSNLDIDEEMLEEISTGEADIADLAFIAHRIMVVALKQKLDWTDAALLAKPVVDDTGDLRIIQKFIDSAEITVTLRGPA